MFGTGTSITNLGMAGGMADAADGVFLAETLLPVTEPGLAISGIDSSIAIRDTGTPANAYAGDANGKLVYASPSTKWILAENGLYQSGTTLRTEYDASGNALGWRIEDARTNLFLNSRTPVTQSIATTAQSYTISGVGAVGATLTLSGAAAGTLTGTGAIDRDSITVTATAGSLTVTVSGTWDFVQVEAGLVASSPIVTAGSTVTRAADIIYLPTTQFPSSLPLTIAVVARVGVFAPSIWPGVVSVRNTGAGTGIHAGFNPSAQAKAVTAATPGSDLSASGFMTAGVRQRIAAAFATNDVVISLNGSAPTADTDVAMPFGADRLQLGAGYNGTQSPVLHVENVLVLPNRRPNAELQGLLA